MKFYLIYLIDVVRGGEVFISNDRNAQRFLTFREFVVKGKKTIG